MTGPMIHLTPQTARRAIALHPFIGSAQVVDRRELTDALVAALVEASVRPADEWTYDGEQLADEISDRITSPYVRGLIADYGTVLLPEIVRVLPDALAAVRGSDGSLTVRKAEA